MNKFLPLLCFMLLGFMSNAQCDDLFFSEYVEGYANNKALEIYNPTDAAIDLSGYSVVRFSNGNTNAGTNKIIQLPDVMIESGDVFVVVVDLTDTDDWDTQFDKPAWNGYNLIDTIFDLVTGLPIIDTLTGEPLLGPQYLEGSALFGTEYNEQYDLQCKADVFLCPEYNINNTMYFNGNDAMALIRGTVVEDDASNLIDVIGVIGEDPVLAFEQDAWVDANGRWLTKDRTLVRKASITTGRNEISQVISQLGGTFIGEEWDVYGKNDFRFLGIHRSTCITQAAEQYSCTAGPIVSTTSVNLIAFNVYPNPNGTGSLNIEAEENIAKVEIINLMGQNVLIETYDSSYPKATINLNSLQKGIYIVKVYFPGKLISTQKLIVQ